MTTKRILTAARQLISDPEKYGDSALAVATNAVAWDSKGRGVSPTSKKACKYHASGVLDVFSSEPDFDNARRKLSSSCETLYGLSAYAVPVTFVADRYGYDAVLRCYDHAIGACS